MQMNDTVIVFDRRKKRTIVFPVFFEWKWNVGGLVFIEKTNQFHSVWLDLIPFEYGIPSAMNAS